MTNIPGKNELDAVLVERHSEEICLRLQRATVGVMGLGDWGRQLQWHWSE